MWRRRLPDPPAPFLASGRKLTSSLFLVHVVHVRSMSNLSTWTMQVFVITE